MSEERTKGDCTTMRIPKDVNQQIKVLAALAGQSVEGWANTILRGFVDKLYRKTLSAESKATAGG